MFSSRRRLSPGLITRVKQFVTSAVSDTNPIVTVKEGKLRGAKQKLIDGSPYYSFKGIPYAQPPVKNLRFKGPLPPKSWDGIRDAIEHGPICPQFDMITRKIHEGNEDCLFLNVYTKSLEPHAKLPVMVFIHGGGFMSGSGDSDMYGPEFLIQHDVILVTLNYRLEVLGFLCLDTPEIPGNVGLKDQVAALRWVQSNIKWFGGDPDNVTIFGHSSGGSCAAFHLLSPMSKGLFHKVIAQSGVCIHDWTLSVAGREKAFRVGNFLGKETTDPDELITFLRSLPANKLTAFFKSSALTKEEKRRALPLLFTPVVEKVVNEETFLSEEPIDTIRSGKAADVPIIAGYTSEEGLTLIENHTKRLEFMCKNPSYYVPKEVQRMVSHDKLLDFGSRMKDFYIGHKNLTHHDIEKASAIQTDIVFSYNINRFANLYANTYNLIYFYRFNCDTELNIFKRLIGLQHYKGACHVDDLYYVFCNVMNKDLYERQEDLRRLVYNVTKMWTDFAKTGNPTPDNILGVKWGPYTVNGKEYLNIDNKLSMAKNPDKERIEFMNDIYIEAGAPHLITNKL